MFAKPSTRFVIVLVAIALASIILAACGGDASTLPTRVREYRYSIENRALPGVASQDILVKRENNLRMDWTVDEAGTFIIEEFGVSQELTPGQSNIVEFQVLTVGVFPMIFKTSDGVETNILDLKVIE